LPGLNLRRGGTNMPLPQYMPFVMSYGVKGPACDTGVEACLSTFFCARESNPKQSGVMLSSVCQFSTPVLSAVRMTPGGI
jgi:hypothetical protein